jgi:hypothetical protein
MDEIASFPELSAELIREIGHSTGFRMGLALNLFKRSKSADKKAAADRVHGWMLDREAIDGILSTYRTHLPRYL